MTPAAWEAAVSSLFAGCTVICVAVIVVAFVVPRTRTFVPLVMALADVALVPFWYVVVDVSFTATFWSAAVVRVKLDVDTLSTVPDEPPAAGPDRALDPPPGIRPDIAEEDVAGGDDAVVAEEDVAHPAHTPITAAMSVAATNRPRFLVDFLHR
jgi:hypothetical protein